MVYVDNCLRGASLRKKVKIAASGKIVSAYDIARICALGADWCKMARPFMFSLGCIQDRDCSSGHCPTGIATMDPLRYRVTDLKDRATRVYNFQKNTRYALKELLEAAGLNHPSDLTRRHIVRRLSASKIKLAERICPNVENFALLNNGRINDPRISSYWERVDKASFSQTTNC